MNIKNQKTIDSELRVKATAALREQIIKELTQPDKSLMVLFGAKDDKNDHSNIDASGETET